MRCARGVSHAGHTGEAVFVRYAWTLRAPFHSMVRKTHWQGNTRLVPSAALSTQAELKRRALFQQDETLKYFDDHELARIPLDRAPRPECRQCRARRCARSGNVRH